MERKIVSLFAVLAAAALLAVPAIAADAPAAGTPEAAPPAATPPAATPPAVTPPVATPPAVTPPAVAPTAPVTAVRAPVAAGSGDTSEAATRAAMEKADPDNVDPVSVRGEKWTLDITYDAPQSILVPGLKGEKDVYWYVIYTITNNTKTDHEYVPSFTLFTDTGVVSKAGVYPTAFEAIKAERSTKYKFLENVAQMTAVAANRVKIGADNARTGVAIFAPMDRATQKFTIFVGGLSGEYIEHPDRGVKKPEPGHLVEGDKVTRLFKTLVLDYDFPGDKWWRNMDQPIFASKKWTWR
jgi:hypothetical protein